MKARLVFAVSVLLACLVPVEGAILLVAWTRRPSNVHVARGAGSTGESGTLTPDEIDRFVQETLRRSGIPGAALAIVQGDRILHVAGYGRNADGSPVTPDTVMPLASLSKSFTSMAVMQLVVRGTVSLDAPITHYLPEFRPVDPRGRRITVRHLLNHSSGLTFESLPSAAVRGRPPLHRSLEERVAWLSHSTLRAEPGTNTTYDNFGYEMLARMVERVSGKSFSDYLRDGVLLPLGMRSTRSFLTTRDPLMGPTGHTLMFGFPVPWHMPPDLVAGAGGIASSANDLAKWLIFHTTDGREGGGTPLLPPEVVAAMHSASSPGGDYGFGWRQGQLVDGTTYYHHSGRIVTFAAHEAVYPHNRIAYAFTVNGLDPIPAGSAALIAGLTAIANGRSPTPAGYGAAIVDHLVVVITILALTTGFVGVVRSGEWAKRRADESRFRNVLRCLPYVALVVVVLLGQAMTVPWQVWWETWPPFAVAYPIVACAAASVVLIRAVRLAALRR